MRPLLSAALVVACLTAGVALPAPTQASSPAKVAIIVGPVGSLTPTYLALAEAAAATAQRHGATVARAYSPHATPGNVLAAVEDASIVIYFGHGYGHPSPYGALDRRRQNGWGLQGPRARGTHDDGLNGYLEYYGEDWIVANARPAPGFVMIYSNTCYAPGASEGGFAPATPAVAAERVASYSRKVFAMGGSAYFATDFDRGAADLVDRLLGNPHASYRSVFGSDHRFVPSALTTQSHWFSAGQQIWLHRTKYTDGPPNYWYAFAGNPDANPARSWDPVAPTAVLEKPAAGAIEVDPTAGIRVRLSEPVTGIGPATVVLVDAQGDRVPATFRHDLASGKLVVRPDAPLALSARYRLVLRAGIADVAGNPLEPMRWSFTTRLDADALAAQLPVVLEPGRHRLIRFAADGSVAEEQTVELGEARSLTARNRARLPGEPGSWFELDADPYAGWWVAESARAHAIGRSDEVSLPPTTVALPSAAETDLADIADDGSVAASTPVQLRTERVVTVDRRTVIDGRTYLRIVDGLPGHDGRWLPVRAADAPVHPDETRLLRTDERARPAAVTLRLGDQPAFRFDAAGRVQERRTIAGGGAHRLVTERTAVVGGARFHVIAGGELDGWAVADASVASVSDLQERDPS